MDQQKNGKSTETSNLIERDSPELRYSSYNDLVSRVLPQSILKSSHQFVEPSSLTAG